LQGWVKIHRNLLEHWHFDNPKLLKIWLWCILRARHMPGEVGFGRKRIPLNQGQLIFGRKSAAAELQMPESTVWDYMKLLQSNGSIDISSTTRYSIISITNWDFYQSCSTDIQTTNDIRMDTNKNGHNDKNFSYAQGAPYPSKAEKKRYLPRNPYYFDSRAGSRSFGPTQEEESSYREFQEEFKVKQSEYMKKMGIQNEEDIEDMSFPTCTEYCNRRLREMREKDKQATK